MAETDFVIACPYCGTEHTATAEFFGLSVQCSNCAQLWVVAPPQEAGAADDVPGWEDELIFGDSAAAGTEAAPPGEAPGMTANDDFDSPAQEPQPPGTLTNSVLANTAAQDMAWPPAAEAGLAAADEAAQSTAEDDSAAFDKAWAALAASNADDETDKAPLSGAAPTDSFGTSGEAFGAASVDPFAEGAAAEPFATLATDNRFSASVAEDPFAAAIADPYGEMALEDVFAKPVAAGAGAIATPQDDPLWPGTAFTQPVRDTGRDAIDDIFASEDFDEDPTGRPDPARQGGLALAAAWALFLCFAGGIMAGAVVFRDGVMTALPGSERLYAAVGMAPQRELLRIEKLAQNWQTRNGQALLTVSGELRNISAEARLPPPLTLSIVASDAATQTVDTSVRETPLAPGETAAFALELSSLPAGLARVDIGFSAAD